MLAGAAVLALLAPAGTAWAQDADACVDADADGQCDDSADTAPAAQSVITVSGTRIRTTEYDFASPVVAIDDTAIQNSGVTNLTDS